MNLVKPFLNTYCHSATPSTFGGRVLKTSKSCLKNVVFVLEPLKSERLITKTSEVAKRIFLFAIGLTFFIPTFVAGQILLKGDQIYTRHIQGLFSKKSETKIDHQSLAKKFLDEGASDNHWHLQDLFGQIYLISGDANRKSAVQARLESVGLSSDQYETVEGLKGESLPERVWSRMEDNFGKSSDKTRKGQTGCFIAHLNVIKEAKRMYDLAKSNYEQAQSTPEKEKALKELKKRSTILIFEDNVGFGRVKKYDSTKASREGVCKKFLTSVSELPHNWDFFYLQSMHYTPSFGGKATNYSPHLKRLNGGLVMKAYAVSANVFDELIENLEVINSSYTPPKAIKPVDHVTAALHRNRRAFAAKEAVCYRSASASMVGDGKASENHWQDDC